MSFKPSSRTPYPTVYHTYPFPLYPYRRPRSLASYHILVLFALSCASWNTIGIRTNKAVSGRELQRECIVVRTFSLGAVHALSKSCNTSIAAARATSCGTLKRCEVLCLVNDLGEAFVECLQRQIIIVGGAEGRLGGGDVKRRAHTSVKSLDSSAAGTSLSLRCSYQTRPQEKCLFVLTIS